MYNNKDNVTEAFQNGFFPFKDEFKKNMSGMSDKRLPNWVYAGKKRFDRIKSQIQNAKKIICKLDHSVVALFNLMNHEN